MMISCQEVITELWDYLDGELPVERATLIADHLAECARCYPQYRFEYAFLAAVARQRAQGPGPSAELVEKVAGTVLANRSASLRVRGERPDVTVEPRRPAPRAAAPLSPRAPLTGMRARAEGWGLAILRSSLGVFLLAWGVGKLVVPAGAAAISPVASGVATLEVVLAALILLGVWRRWSYAAAFVVHVGSLLLLWRTFQDPWGVALAGLPVCGALVALYLLRERDLWALDTWLAWRRPWRVVR
jgi:anti-sigma factor (TIGR02949 family)